MTEQGYAADGAGGIDRRTVLKGAMTASVAGLGATTLGGTAAAHEGATFAIEQGDTCVEVSALSNGETVEDFYGYTPVHSHTSTDIERSDVSNLFLYEGPDGARSLVALHDLATDGHTHGSDTGGGAVSFDISGLSSGSWVVRDDSEFSTTDTSPDWAWAGSQTDGGAWRGGLGCDFEVTIDPAFNEAAEKDPLTPGSIDEWHFLSRDASDPDRIDLDLSEPVTIRCGGCVRVGEVQFKGCSEVWITFENFQGETNDIQVNVDGSWETVTVHEDDLTTIPGQFGHDTPVFKYPVDDGEKLLGVRVGGDEYTNHHRCAQNGSNGNGNGRNA